MSNLERTPQLALLEEGGLGWPNLDRRRDR
jgi:hypothetical protein